MKKKTQKQLEIIHNQLQRLFISLENISSTEFSDSDLKKFNAIKDDSGKLLVKFGTFKVKVSEDCESNSK